MFDDKIEEIISITLMRVLQKRHLRQNSFAGVYLYAGSHVFSLPKKTLCRAIPYRSPRKKEAAVQYL